MASVKKKLTDAEILQDKTNVIMNTVAERCAYYRANPQRFCKDYLNIDLKLFQKILIWAMNVYDFFEFVAVRGIGKTFLVALFCCVRAILWPGTKILACSFTFKQGKEVLNKITEDFMHKSPLLCSEISKVSTGQNDCYISFKNGSFIKVVVAGESSRGYRSNILIIDERRLVDPKIISTILQPMNAAPRQPGYLKKPEYANMQEMNKELSMSSAWYAASDLYQATKSFVANLLNPNLKWFVCDLPYQLSIAEGLLMRQTIVNKMSDPTFSDIGFMMEYEGLFYGSAEDALFDYKILDGRRVLTESLHELEYYRMNGLKVPDKKAGEKRILSVDVALLASKRHDNDASAIMIHSAIPTNNNDYIDNIVYIETQEGLITDELGLLVMRYFYQYDCDYIVLDTNGLGIGVLDFLLADRFDASFGITYPALDVINDPDMSERCKVKGARKVIYSIKANAKFNNDITLALRSGFQNGYINLLVSDIAADDILSKIKGFSKLSDIQQTRMKLPYVQTTLLINELINLTHDTSNGLIRVKEKSGMRKDRYSSCAYGYYIIQELSKALKPRDGANALLDKLVIRPAKRIGHY